MSTAGVHLSLLLPYILGSGEPPNPSRSRSRTSGLSRSVGFEVKPGPFLEALRSVEVKGGKWTYTLKNDRWSG